MFKLFYNYDNYQFYFMSLMCYVISFFCSQKVEIANLREAITKQQYCHLKELKAWELQVISRGRVTTGWQGDILCVDLHRLELCLFP